MKQKKQLFAIYGYPLSHSKSPAMHNKALKHLKLKPTYTKIELISATSNALKDSFLANRLKGCNITLPHKEEAYKQADKVVSPADKIKAVNTYVLKKGKIIGYNTDIYGFKKSIKKDIKKYKIKNTLILGAGGVAKAVALACKKLKLHTMVANRSEAKLAFFSSIKCEVSTYEKLELKLKKYDLIINATSAGLKDNTLPMDKTKLKKLLKNSKYAYDCIYGKETAFLALAKKLGVKTQDGLNMLLFQGVRALELFLDKKLDKKTIKKMKQALL